MEAASEKRPESGGSGGNGESHHSGLDQLLWNVLQVGTVPGMQTPESYFEEMGDEEIQEVEGPKTENEEMVRKSHWTGAKTLRTLAVFRLQTCDWMMGAV